MASSKLAYERSHTGQLPMEQAQRLGQKAAQEINHLIDEITVLKNRGYAALTTDVTINIAAYAPLLTTTIRTLLANGFVILTLTASGAQAAGAGTIYFQILVDDVVVKGVWSTVGAGDAFSVSLLARVAVRAGNHVVKVQWRTSVNGARVNAATSVEEHAHVLAQEAA